MQQQLKYSKKGQADFILIVIVVFIAVIAGGLVWFIMDVLNVNIKNSPELAGHTETIDQASGVMDTMLNVGITSLIIAVFLSLLISFAFIGSHPIVLLIHIVVLGITILISAELSNIYTDTIATVPELAVYYQTKMIYPTMIIQNLPIMLTIFGFISLVILGGKYFYDKNHGGGAGGIYVN